MNDKHIGPHCAGSCEGAAYQIEIRKLNAENEALREALAEMLDLHSSQHNSPTHAAARAVLRGSLRVGE